MENRLPYSDDLRPALDHWGRLLAATAGFILVNCLTGCAGRSSDPLPPVDTSIPFSRSGEVTVPAQWWTQFDDPQLNALVDRAFAGNLDLEASWERLQAARAVARRQSSGFFPDLDGFAAAEASRSDGVPGDSDFYQLGLAASYEVDLWGRIRATVDAERFRAEATRLDYETTALLLAGEVALTWYRLVEAEQALELLEEQIEANEKILQSLKNRFQGGQVRSVDILRQQQLLEATREQKIIAESDREAFVHQLFVLLGQPPQSEPGWTVSDLPALPPAPATGLPSELILRRPDIQAAFNRLQAADRDVAAAVSERYPRLNMTASLSTSAGEPSQLFSDWTRSIAGELVGAIVDGGERRAEVSRTEAVKRQRIAEFGQASLLAFREVEDALTLEQKQQQRIESLRTQVELQAGAYEKLQLQYSNGVSDFIDVLTALTEAQQLQRDLLVAERQLIEFRIALHRALAGPLNVEPTPTEP